MASKDLFSSVCFYIAPSIKHDVRIALNELLVNSGATPCPPLAHPDTYMSLDSTDSAPAHLPPPRFDPARLTHFIADSLDFPEYALLRPDGAERDRKGKSVHKGEETKHKVEIVSPAWVTRTYDLQSLQPPRFYSADPFLFLSGTVICTSDFPEADNLAIAGAVEAFGGQFRRELTREVTHLICVAEHGAKYEMAMKFGTELGMVVVLPHWFEESLKLAQLVPVDIYRFPSPPFSTSLRDGTSSRPFAERLHDYWRARNAAAPAPAGEGASTAMAGRSYSASTSGSGVASTTTANGTSSAALPATEAKTATAVILSGLLSPFLSTAPDADAYLRQTSDVHSAFRDSRASLGPGGAVSAPQPGRAKARIFEGVKVYLGSDLGLSASLQDALKGAIEHAGGTCWAFGVDGRGEREGKKAREAGGGYGGEEGEEKGGGGGWEQRRRAEKRLREAGLVILRVREGWEFWTAYDLNIPLGNLSYLYHTLSTSTLPSPTARLLHYPLPSLSGVPAFRDKFLTVSNYAGPARDYVRAMIEVLGGTFEGTMSKGHTSFVVSASEYGSKVSHARTWSIPLVTHLWLEACVKTWSLVPPHSHPSYLLAPAGTASETHFTALLPSTSGTGSGWTRELLEDWAERTESREARESAMKPLEELMMEVEREEEEARRRAAEEAGVEEGGEEDERMGEPSPPPPAPAPAPKSKPKARDARAQSTLVVADTFSPEKEMDKEKERAPSKPPKKPVAAAVKSASPPPPPAPPAKTKKRASATPAPPPVEEEEDDKMDVEDDVFARPAAPAPAHGGASTSTLKAPPAAVETPAKKGKGKVSKKAAAAEEEKEAKKGKGKAKRTEKEKASKADRKRSSSPLSSASSDSSSSSSDDSPPPSAHRMPKTFAQISDQNLVVPGSKRGAAAKARAAVSKAMEDKNRFEKEQQKLGSAKKPGVGRRVSQVSQRSSSPVKRGRAVEAAEEEEDEDEEDDPAPKKKAPAAAASKSKKRPPKEVVDLAAVDDEDDDVPARVVEPPKKKHKALKAVQASAGGGTTQEGGTGAVSSFDNPPKGKAAPVTKSMKVKIISTGLGLDKHSPEIKSLKSLGASWTDQPRDATHLIVKGISRTEKFLCCLPFAPKVVTKSWVDACIAAGRLVDELPYLLHDEKKEKEIGDTLEAILARAKKGKLLAGYDIYLTNGVSPDPPTMQRIITACGGVAHVKNVSKFIKQIMDDDDSFVVSAPGDRKEWDAVAARKKPIYGVEAVFVAVLHQDLKRGFNDNHRIDPQLA
ncbi:hypothetical protein JCM8097_004873 [Rhodosporidiobolus ruineniae]